MKTIGKLVGGKSVQEKKGAKPAEKAPEAKAEAAKTDGEPKAKQKGAKPAEKAPEAKAE